MSINSSTHKPQTTEGTKSTTLIQSVIFYKRSIVSAITPSISAFLNAIVEYHVKGRRTELNVVDNGSFEHRGFTLRTLRSPSGRQDVDAGLLLTHFVQAMIPRTSMEKGFQPLNDK